MAKSRRRSRTRRDVRTITNANALPGIGLSLFPDARVWHPDDLVAGRRTIFGTPTHLVVRSKRSAPHLNRAGRFLQRKVKGKLKAAVTPSWYPAANVAFTRPDLIAVCIRRKIRREVLHAFGKAGKVGQKIAKRGKFSDIHC